MPLYFLLYYHHHAMATIASLWEWRVLNDIVYIWENTSEWSHAIILRRKKWEPMKYWVNTPFVIDFPGEYEHGWIVIRCREAGEELHYVLRFESTETVALLFNPKSVEHDALKTVQNYFCIDSDTKERIEQNEFEGVIKLFDESSAQ